MLRILRNTALRKQGALWIQLTCVQGCFLASQRLFAEAGQLWEDAYRAYLKRGAARAFSTMKSEMQLGQLALVLGHRRHAEKLLSSALSRAADLPPDDPLAILIQFHWILAISTDAAPSESTRQRLTEVLQRAQRSGLPRFVYSGLELRAAILLKDHGDASGALEKMEGARQFTSGEAGESFSAICGSGLRAAYLAEQGDLAAAIPLYTSTLQRLRQRIGQDEPETLDCMLDLAKITVTSADTQAMTLILEVLDSLQARCSPTAYDFFRLAGYATDTLVLLEQGGKLSRVHRGAVLPALHAISRRMAAELELRETWHGSQDRDFFWDFHNNWFYLSRRHEDPVDLQPLLQLHGAEAWATVIAGLYTGQRRGHSLTPAQESYWLARTELNLVRARLRQRRVGRPGPTGEDTGIPRSGLERAERRALDRYERASQALRKVDPGFAAARGIEHHEFLDALQLPEDEAVAVLFANRGDCFALLIRTGRAPHLLDLPHLEELLRETERYLDPARESVASRLQATAISGGSASSESPHLESILRRLTQALWLPLESYARVNTWHIVTSEHFHALPFDLRRETAAYYYPGLPALYRMRRRLRGTTSGERPRFCMISDSAPSSEEPLPFVWAEAECLARVLELAGIPFDQRRGSDLFDSPPEVNWLHFAGHGQLVGAASSAHGTVVLDFNSSAILDPPRVSQLSPLVQEVFLSNCLGGVMSNTSAGGAHGLPAALLMRGADVIGSLAPLPDFYMAIVSALYWYARTQQAARAEWSSPAQALALVKKQLLRGSWPQEVVNIVRDVYGSLTLRVLSDISALCDTPDDPAALRLARAALDGWCLPTTLGSLLAEYGQGTVEESLQFAQQCCRTPRRRERLTGQILQVLVDERERPALSSRRAFGHISAFLMCWGGHPGRW